MGRQRKTEKIRLISPEPDIVQQTIVRAMKLADEAVAVDAIAERIDQIRRRIRHCLATGDPVRRRGITMHLLDL